MLIQESIQSPPAAEPDWHKRWEGPDKGLICAWLQGIDKAQHDADMAQCARNGELPVTAFRGGIVKALKNRDIMKLGALHYVAYWQGLRGEDLDIDQDTEPQLTCSRTGMTFVYTGDTAKLLAATANEGDTI